MVKIVQLTRNTITYELEFDTSDDTVQSVTIVDGGPLEHDVDPQIFEDSLTSEEWTQIRQALVGDAE